MEVTLTVTAQVNRTQGKFASKEEIAQQLVEAIEGADPSSVEGENGGEYTVDSWEVTWH